MEAAYAGDGPHGGANFGRKVRQGRHVVARQRGRSGELIAGKLHPVAGIPGEADDNGISLLGLGDVRLPNSHTLPTFLPSLQQTNRL